VRSERLDFLYVEVKSKEEEKRKEEEEEEKKKTEFC
jgi:hypothetical protein